MAKHKLVIAGSRHYTNAAELAFILEGWSKMGAEDLIVVSLNEPGASTLGEQWATGLGFVIEKWGADRPLLAKKAGFVRNRHLVLEGGITALLVVRDQRVSQEHDHLVEMAQKLGIPTHVERVKTVIEKKKPAPKTGKPEDAPLFNTTEAA